MAVPRMTEIRPGINVNIVLKADQRTGKLTRGQVSDILTRGDHPRGIKVRLKDGQIGRVQSLCSPSSSESANAEPVIQSTQGAAPRARGVQNDYRLGPEPAATASLLDYVRAPKQGKGKGGGVEKAVDDVTSQQLLEGEFPKLDSALIAAILSDHEFDLSSARATLSSLS
jgi:uncharacterized repeat protein (TIGR03833 family)